MTQNEIVCANCKKFREESKMTQEAVASSIDMSIDAVRTWEQGKKVPGRDALAKLARLYHRSLDDFFVEEPPPPKKAPPPYEVRFHTVGDVPQGFLDDIEAIRRKWDPAKLAEHQRTRDELKKGKKR